MLEDGSLPQMECSLEVRMMERYILLYRVCKNSGISITGSITYALYLCNLAPSHELLAGDLWL
uniref:Uncharacterized protein n=1 Tax=Aegilops tauschii subsp. strangulata TaxID=200361 RepID=A0A452YNF2_AEGTS